MVLTNAFASMLIIVKECSTSPEDLSIHLSDSPEKKITDRLLS